MLRLDDYQLEGIDFLREGNKLLGDKMGLGKSAQSIVAAEGVLNKKPSYWKVLVVTKKSMITEWKHEIRKWSNRSVGVLTTQSDYPDDVDFIVTNYRALFKWDLNKHHILIVDESHKVKNRKTKTFKCVRDLARKAEFVWLLTASPSPNGPQDLWAQFNILDHKTFPSFWNWANMFLYVWHNGFGMEVGEVRPDAKDMWDKYRDMYMLQRTKEILDLPPLSMESVRVGWQNRQREIYDQMKYSMILDMGDRLELTDHVLSQLTRLRQIATDPVTIKEDMGGSGKTEWIKEFAEDTQEQVLIFSQFSTYIDHIVDELGGSAGKLIGSMSSNQRDEVMKSFRAGDIQFLCGTIGAMGEGLNLQQAEIVIFSDLPWTPDEFQQAYSRAHRRGQENPVHVIKLLSENSVDGYMDELLHKKDRIISEALAQRTILERIKEEG